MSEEFVTRPDLSTWGIEAVEANVCEDTFENRQILNGVKLKYRVLEPGLIEVLFNDYSELNKHHANQYESKKIILRDQKNPWSDFVPFDELPLEYMEEAPAWIKRHLNKYDDARDAGTPEHKLPVLPKRCQRVRADGSRCWQWSWPAIQAEGFCRSHTSNASFNSGAQMARMTDAAKMRLSQLSGPAMDALEDLVLNSTVPHVRLKASTEILDRVGIRGGSELTISGEVNHTVQDPSELVREKLNSLHARLEAAKPVELGPAETESSSIVVDAEIVEEGETDD